MDLAAGLMNFLRTLSGAIATSVVTTNWSDRITYNHAELVGLADSDGAVRSLLERAAMTPEALSQTIDYLITSQSVMLATNEMMALLGLLFIFSATLIWLAPRPARAKDAAAHGGAERGRQGGALRPVPEREKGGRGVPFRFPVSARCKVKSVCLDLTDDGSGYGINFTADMVGILHDLHVLLGLRIDLQSSHGFWRYCLPAQ